MPAPTNGGHRYELEALASIVRLLKRLQRQAALEGRGNEMLLALRQIGRRLQTDPLNLGEPLFRLPTLRIQIRTVSLRPLVIDFGVCEDRPLVFFRSIKLLTKST
jgi:hypothetical protein